MVSKLRRSCRSKHLTYLECGTNMDTTTQTRMKIEHLNNELFRWLQAGQCRNFCLLRAKKANSCGSMRPWFNLNPSTPEPAPNKLHSSIRKETLHSKAAERKERLQTILWNFGICGKDRVSRNAAWHYHKPDSWTSSSALFPPWFECQHPWWICLRSSVSVATNHLCFVSTILCFYQHFF